MTHPTQSTDADVSVDAESKSVWKAPFVVITIAYIMARGSNVIFGPAKNDIATDLGATLPEVMGSRTATYLISAIIVIPVAILITRISPGALAWIGILLLGIGKATMGLSPEVTIFYTGAIVAMSGSVMLTPLFGQIGRDVLSVRTFVVATTLVVVFGRAMQTGSLMLTGMVYETFGWRIIYISWGVAMIPVSFMAWRFIKPQKPTAEVDSVGKLIVKFGSLVRQPLVWMCGISCGLAMASVSNFGFVWDLNFQDSLGWDIGKANLLTFLFVAGVITGGYFITLLSKWIGEYLSIFLSMSVGVVMFFICIFVTSSLREIWISGPMLFVVGVFLGAGSMIQPHISRFYDKHLSAMFFGVTSAIYLLFAGFAVSVPEWSLPASSDWSLPEMRHAIFPYVIMIAIGVMVFGFTNLAARFAGAKSSRS